MNKERERERSGTRKERRRDRQGEKNGGERERGERERDERRGPWSDRDRELGVSSLSLPSRFSNLRVGREKGPISHTLSLALCALNTLATTGNGKNRKKIPI